MAVLHFRVNSTLGIIYSLWNLYTFLYYKFLHYYSLREHRNKEPDLFYNQIFRINLINIIFGIIVQQVN